jgi:hypothetical protein
LMVQSYLLQSTNMDSMRFGATAENSLRMRLVAVLLLNFGHSQAPRGRRYVQQPRYADRMRVGWRLTWSFVGL